MTGISPPRINRFAELVKRKQMQVVDHDKMRLPTFEEMSILKCPPQRLMLMERRKKDNHEQEMIEKTSKMKFMD
jgi:hypothetical protein